MSNFWKYEFIILIENSDPTNVAIECKWQQEKISTSSWRNIRRPLNALNCRFLNMAKRIGHEHTHMWTEVLSVTSMNITIS
jgi:hypothetical protein